MVEKFPEDPRTYLQNEFQIRLKRRPFYSMRAFARDLDLSPSTLTEFFKGKYGFSRARALTLAKKVALSSEQTEHFCDLLEARFSKKADLRAVARVKAQSRIKSQHSNLSLDLFKTMADWRHLAMVELIGQNKKYQDPQIIAESLGMSSRAVKLYLNRLVKVGLLSFHEMEYSVVTDHTFVGEEIPSEAIRKFHQGVLSSAALALAEQPIDQREYSSTLFSIQRKDLPTLKKELKKMRLDLIGKISGSDKNDAVYCLAIQLFDVLKSEVSCKS
jgi:uncharacterized protein (TIGR02147 family)